MRFRAAFILSIALFCVSAGSAVRLFADEPTVEELTKLLGSGDAGAQLKAEDALAELGPSAAHAVPALIKALGSTNEEVQWHAAAALSEIGPAAKDAVQPLTAALKSSSPMVRGHAAHALEEIGPPAQSAVPELAKLLADKDKNVARAAIDALIAIRPSTTILAPILKQALENNDMDPSLIVPALNALAELGDLGMKTLIEELNNEKVQYWAVLALGEAGPKAKGATNDLAKLVASKEPQIRMQALITLGEIGPDAKSAAPAIIKALGDEQMSTRYAATFALGKIGAKEAIPELSKQLDSKDNFLKMVSAWSLAKISPTDIPTVQAAIKMLGAALKDPDKHVRAAAARGLFELNVSREQMLPLISELVEDKDPTVRAHVVDAMASLGEKALPRLIKALSSDDTQGIAVAVIRQLGPKAKDAVPNLIEELKDPDAAYRRDVCLALAAIGPDAKDAVSALLKTLGDENLSVRHVAIYALGKIGPSASAAVPDLKKYLQSDDQFTRVATVWALVHIQPKDLEFRLKAIPLLSEALKNTDREPVRIEIANTLGEIGPPAIIAAPILDGMASNDPSPMVREAAQAALKKIRPGK